MFAKYIEGSVPGTIALKAQWKDVFLCSCHIDV